MTNDPIFPKTVSMLSAYVVIAELLYSLFRDYINFKPIWSRRGSLAPPLKSQEPLKVAKSNFAHYLGSTRIYKETFRNLTYEVTMVIKAMVKFEPPQNQTNYISFER